MHRCPLDVLEFLDLFYTLYADMVGWSSVLCISIAHGVMQNCMIEMLYHPLSNLPYALFPCFLHAKVHPNFLFLNCKEIF